MKKLNLKDVTPQILKGNIDGPNWYSGKGQDSFIKHIFDTIGTTNMFCVEFGGTDGHAASNTLYLNQTGWSRILFERNNQNPSINLFNENLTKENICSIFKKYNIPKIFDFLSVDVDGNDYWLLSALLEEFCPIVIMTEINSRFDIHESVIMKYDKDYSWDGHSWYGASAYAFYLLGKKHNYSLVHTYKDEAFLIHNKYLHIDDQNLNIEDVYQPTREIYHDHDLEINSTNFIYL